MPGTGTAVSWVEPQVVPGLVFGVPQLPFRRLDGPPSEDHEAEPDLPAPSDPAAWARGRDPQLDAAVGAPLPGAGSPRPKP